MPRARATSCDPVGRDLLQWDRTDLERVFAQAAISTAHVETVWADVHRRLACNIETMEHAPARLKRWLIDAGFTIGTPAIDREIASADGFTRKYLVRFADDVAVETVLMRFRGRATACISTQAGCAMGCVFCATGQGGLVRHLTAGEIAAQAYLVARILRASGEKLRNVVLMGQGEPLHNYDASLRAVDLLIDPKGQAIANTRVTLSTVGVVPGILRMAEERRRIALAVSLHAANDSERVALVPVARRWPLAEILRACRLYTTNTGNKVFFEWTLIAGQTDGAERARELAALLKGQKAHVNLIPLNPTGAFAAMPTSLVAAREFAHVLQQHGVPATVRQRRGIDIAAGCGQLASVSTVPASANRAPA